MQSLFLRVAEKKSLLSKIKKIGRFSKKNISKILYYLTFLNLGVLKNIILRLKNNIEMVRAGRYKVLNQNSLEKESFQKLNACSKSEMT